MSGHDTSVRRVVRLDEGASFTALGAEVIRLIHPSTVPDATRVQISLCQQGPGELIRPHRHTVEELYYVVSGRGRMVLEGYPPFDLEPGMAVQIPGGAIHGQRNTGVEPLVIVCALAPPLTDAPELIDDPVWLEGLS